MKKILFLADLFASNPFQRDRLPGLSKAASLAASDVEIMDVYELLDGGFYKATGSHDKIKELVEEFGRKALSQQLFAFVIDKQFTHIVFANAGNIKKYIDIEFFSNANAHGILTSVFLGDDEFDFADNQIFYEICDVPVVYLKSIAEKYNRRYANKAYLMPNGISPLPSAATKAAPEGLSDVVFYGKNFGVREQLISFLCDNGIKVTCFGKGWQTIESRNNFKNGGFLDSSEFYQVLSFYPVHLCLLENHLDGEIHWTTKLADVAKMNARAVITHHPDGIDTHNLQSHLDSNNLHSYKAGDPEDLLRAVRKALSDKDVPSSLGSFYQKHFDYSQLYSEFFSYIAEKRIEKREFRRRFFAPGNNSYKLGRGQKFVREVIRTTMSEDKSHDYVASIP